MKSAYYGRTATRTSALLFKEVITLYNETHAGKKELLTGAKAVVNRRINYKSGFASWLATMKPPAQVNALLSSCEKIEDFCLKLKVLKAPLFETTDLATLKLAQNTVSHNVVFRVANKMQMGSIDTAMDCILKYVKAKKLYSSLPSSSSIDQSDIVCKSRKVLDPYVRTDQDQRLNAKYPLVYKRIFVAMTDYKDSSTTITNLYERINHIARCAVIEDILDNVSWSQCSGMLYRFSEEIVHHDEPVEILDADSKVEDVRTIAAAQVVDFNDITNYSYSKPISVSYFEDKITDLSSWKDAYVKLVAFLYDDYPRIIPVAKSFTGAGRPDFGCEEVAKKMADPKPIFEQMYLETNLSATDIVKKVKALLDICRVDYENVIIEYQLVSDVMATPCSPTARHSPILSNNIDSNTFISFLHNCEKMADATCRSYASAISTAECFAKRNHFEHCKLFTSDLREARATMVALLSNADFIKYDIQQHNRFRAALKKFLEFLRVDSSVSVPNKNAGGETTQSLEDTRITSVLMDNFRHGFRLGSPIELRKFRRCYEQLHDVALIADDPTVERIIRTCGVSFEGKVYMPQVMLDQNIRQRLFAYIRKSFDDGKTVLYYQALFNEFSEDFLDYYIYNAEMLKEYLSYMLKGKYYFGRSYLSKEAGTVANPIDEIRTCLKEHVTPMTYGVIFENLPHIPQQKIKHILSTNLEFVNNGRGEYFHVSSVHLSDEELDNIAEIIAVAIENKEYLSGNELILAIKTKYPYAYEKNNIFSAAGLRDAIRYHLYRDFSFSGNIISKRGSPLTMLDVFADYCRSRDSFTIDELNVLADELGTTIYFDPVYENSLRISNSHFVSKARAHFLVSETDATLDLFCTGDYTSVSSVNGFSLFPNAGFPWNEYLLEHYVAAYSDKYILFHIGFTANSCVGVIAKRSAGFKDFDDCITTILADSDIVLKQKPALQYLCNQGYIARRVYSNIEDVLIRATAQRNRKGTL